MLSHSTIHHVDQAIKWDLDGIKGGYHQQKQPELQRPILHADPPSARPKLPRPTCMTLEESKPYIRIQRNDEYTLFFEEEYKYFKSEYRSVKKLDRNILYNGKTGNVKLIDFGGSKPLEGCNQDNSVQAKSSDSASGSSGETPDFGPTEVSDMKNVGDLLYHF
ncbi:hypothetical protein BASA83_009428 [Batrachochytrium salamandrivorans]|nr:hypothetical protein BASA83_009428 [Batrachochytrium salamandrivorans]